jgi:hypothetical protein
MELYNILWPRRRMRLLRELILHGGLFDCGAEEATQPLLSKHPWACNWHMLRKWRRDMLTASRQGQGTDNIPRRNNPDLLLLILNCHRFCKKTIITESNKFVSAQVVLYFGACTPALMTMAANCGVTYREAKKYSCRSSACALQERGCCEL